MRGHGWDAVVSASGEAGATAASRMADAIVAGMNRAAARALKGRAGMADNSSLFPARQGEAAAAVCWHYCHAKAGAKASEISETADGASPPSNLFYTPPTHPAGRLYTFCDPNSTKRQAGGAMFDSLSDRLEGVFKNLRGQGKITEANVKEAMRDVRMALLEADVNYKVVKDFLGNVQAKALGDEVLLSVTPGQQMVKVIYDELVEVLGGQNPPFALQQGRTNVILMLGLQGSGKTTFCGKLARRFAKEGWKPMLVACDIYRPAAVHQLEVVGAQVGVPVFSAGITPPAAGIARRGLDAAKAEGRNLVIVDTAGRLHINDVLMDELVEIREAVKPSFTFLVADAMTGQDAVVSASTFNEKVGIDGVCLTKMDGDARGGAALSIKSITGKPVKFVGTGEKLEDLEEFFPDRMASRILGMGDIVSLVEKAQEHFDEKQAMDLQKKMRTASFTLQDFLDQMQQVKRMGPLKGLLEMIPGVGSALKGVDIPEKEMKRTEAIIQSMTAAERGEPSLLNGKRKERIARGSGTTPAEVNALIAQFEKARDMMRGMMEMTDRMRAAGGGADGEGMRSSITGAGISARERERRLQRKSFEKRMRQQQAKRARQRKK
jgi:signal recognition particle subunit SRP54